MDVGGHGVEDVAPGGLRESAAFLHPRLAVRVVVVHLRLGARRERVVADVLREVLQLDRRVRVQLLGVGQRLGALLHVQTLAEALGVHGRRVQRGVFQTWRLAVLETRKEGR